MVKSSTQKNTGVENFRPKKIRRTPRHIYTRVPPPPPPPPWAMDYSKVDHPNIDYPQIIITLLFMGWVRDGVYGWEQGFIIVM